MEDQGQDPCCGSVCQDVESEKSNPGALPSSPAFMQVVRRPFISQDHMICLTQSLCKVFTCVSKHCDRGTQLAQVSINNNRYCWRPIHLMTDKPTNIWHTAIMLQYLGNYELDFDETWWKCWNVGSIDCIKISLHYAARALRYVQSA